MRVFERLFDQNKNIKLTIISSLQYGDYATKTTRSDYESALRIIEKYPTHITWHKTLPNSEVLSILQQADVGLLPTWADTYGYSVLEAQACGCPVITTDIRALPEINNDSCGWMINVPKDHLGNGIVGTPVERKRFSETIDEQLESTVLAILSNPNSISEKGSMSVKRIVENHCPEKHAKRLAEIYAEATV